MENKFIEFEKQSSPTPLTIPSIENPFERRFLAISTPNHHKVSFKPNQEIRERYKSNTSFLVLPRPPHKLAKSKTYSRCISLIRSCTQTRNLIIPIWNNAAQESVINNKSSITENSKEHFQNEFKKNHANISFQQKTDYNLNFKKKNRFKAKFQDLYSGGIFFNKYKQQFNEKLRKNTKNKVSKEKEEDDVTQNSIKESIIISDKTNNKTPIKNKGCQIFPINPQSKYPLSKFSKILIDQKQPKNLQTKVQTTVTCNRPPKKCDQLIQDSARKFLAPENTLTQVPVLPKRSKPKLARYKPGIITDSFKKIHTKINPGNIQNKSQRKLSLDYPLKFETLNNNTFNKFATNTRPAKSNKSQSLANVNHQASVIDNSPYKRIIWGARTRRGYNMHDLHKKNQDSFFTHSNFLGHENVHLFGVCDGHGHSGEKVAEYVSKFYPEFLKTVFFSSDKSESENGDSLSIESLMFEALKLTVEHMNDSDFDRQFSGCTFNAILFYRNKLCSCNVGDSRSLMSYASSLRKVIQLSRDHKPDVLSERKRIEDKNGRVEQMKDQNGLLCGPLRVWKKHDNLPGLAMTRAIGDEFAQTIGVSWKPDMVVRELRTNERVMVFLSTDGVFEVVHNEAVMDIAAQFFESQDVEAACDRIMSKVLKSWEQKMYDVTDDITFILAYY